MSVLEDELYWLSDEGNKPSANADFCSVKGMISAFMGALLHGYPDRL